MNKKVIHSVPNSKYGLIFVKGRAKHGRFLAKMWALYGQNSSFCDFLHIQSVIELFSMGICLMYTRAHSNRCKQKFIINIISASTTECAYILHKVPRLIQFGIIFAWVPSRHCPNAWGAWHIVLPCSHGPVSQNYYLGNFKFSNTSIFRPMLEEQARNPTNTGCDRDNYFECGEKCGNFKSLRR